MNNNGDKVCLVIKNTIEKNSLISNGESVLVAVSGGADSVCLVDALCRIKDELGIKVAAAHINHMIRGAEADSDQKYVESLCKKLGIKLHSIKVDVPAIAEKDGISEELAGRKVRYEVFERLAKEFGYTKIATAHNRNDKAETVLMRLIRGTGTDGLVGIKYNRGDGVVRPLLDVMRSDIEDYCEKRELKYCTDSTNLSSDYTRNRIRNELIPFIEERFNPAITDALCTLADNSFEDAEFINGYAERLYKRVNSPMPRRNPDLLDIESLNMINDSICSRLIRIAARNKMGSDYKLERVHIEAVKKLLNKETGACAELPDGLRAVVKYGWIEFTTTSDNEQEDFCYEVEIEKQLKTEKGSFKFEVVNVDKIKKTDFAVDYGKLDGQKLVIRNRKKGDRIVLYKDGGSKKIKDYWIDKKVPRSERGKIPLLCTENEIVAVIGDRVAENYKIKQNSTKGLVITYEQYEDR